VRVALDFIIYSQEVHAEALSQESIFLVFLLGRMLLNGRTLTLLPFMPDYETNIVVFVNTAM